MKKVREMKLATGRNVSVVKSGPKPKDMIDVLQVVVVWYS